MLRATPHTIAGQKIVIDITMPDDEVRMSLVTPVKIMAGCESATENVVAQAVAEITGGGNSC